METKEKKVDQIEEYLESLINTKNKICLPESTAPRLLKL